MAKQLIKRITEELKASGWKSKTSIPLYTYVKDNFEIDIIPGLNRSYKVVISKQSKMSVSNSMLIDAEQVVELLRNPIVHY